MVGLVVWLGMNSLMLKCVIVVIFRIMLLGIMGLFGRCWLILGIRLLVMCRVFVLNVRFNVVLVVFMVGLFVCMSVLFIVRGMELIVYSDIVNVWVWLSYGLVLVVLLLNVVFRWLVKLWLDSVRLVFRNSVLF